MPCRLSLAVVNGEHWTPTSPAHKSTKVSLSGWNKRQPDSPIDFLATGIGVKSELALTDYRNIQVMAGNKKRSHKKANGGECQKKSKLKEGKPPQDSTRGCVKGWNK